MKKQISYQNQKINYKIEGKGRALVLLHGFMEDLEMWSRHSEELSNQYQVLSIDLPGHGETGIWSDNHVMGFMAKMVGHVLDTEKIDSCVMIGHSMGGYVTLAFADKYPERLHGFGLFHSHAMADSEEAKKDRDRTIEIIKQQKAGFIHQFIPSLFAEENRILFEKEIAQLVASANQMNPQGIIAAISGMKERTMRLDVVAFSEIPVLFILGKQDSRIALDHALAQASTARLAQISILGNSGHMGWLEDCNKTIAAMKGFMIFCQD